MKKFRLLSFIGGSVCYIALAMLLSGYGNKQNHPSINGFIVDAFLSKNNQGQFSMTKFQQYRFMFDIEKFSGDGITKEGLFHPSHSPAPGNYPISFFEEGKMEFTVRGWLKHGGMSADVPEVPASLRHFYDPTLPAGQRYLQDKVNGRLMSFLQSLLPNPQIDHEEWAIGKPGGFGTEEHNYTYENGKVWLKGALETNDPNKRKEFMAKAWRALGETLHYIADNGCPSHVRDDAHPSPFWDYNDILGNPDPYEEWMAIIENESSSEFAGFASGWESRVDQSIKDKLRQHKTAKEVAHELAVWTNRNFFTTETISGTDWKGNKVIPITHPEKTYPSPKLDNMTYSNYYYTGAVAGQTVKHCTDLTYIAKIIPTRGYPYIDKECVRSQAAVLIPNIIEAGMNVVKLFIPAMKVEITEAKNGVVKGKVTHATDEEYTTQIKYAGRVKVIIKGSDYKIKKEAFCEAVNGNFEAQDLGFSTGDLAFAEIEFGGVLVEAKEFNCQGEGDKVLETLLKTLRFSQGTNNLLVKMENSYLSNGVITSKTTVDEVKSPSFQTGQSNMGNRSLIWSGLSFSSSFDSTYGNTTIKNTVSGIVSSDAKTLIKMSWSWTIKEESESSWEGTTYVVQEERSESLEIVNIPMRSWLENYGVFYEINGIACKPLVAKYNYFRRSFNSQTTGSYTRSEESLEKSLSFDIKSDGHIYSSFWQ